MDLHALKKARELLQAELPYVEKNIYFRGVPLMEFEKEDLVRIVAWSRRETEQMQQNADQNRRMQQMFSESRRIK